MENYFDRGRRFFSDRSFLSKIRLYFLSALGIFLAVFLYLKILPFGQAAYTRSYGSWIHSGKGFIYGFTPAERIGTSTADGAVIIGDPVYFSVFTPRKFEKAKLTVTYRDNLDIHTPVVEAGVLADNVVWRYDLQPLENKSLDYLLLRRQAVREGKTVLIQAEDDYSSLEDWQADFSDGHLAGCDSLFDNCLAVYNHDLPYDYHPANYRAPLPAVIDTPLRGDHQAYIYLDGEILAVTADFIDQNLDKKAAPMSLILYSGTKVVARRDLDDPNPYPGSGRQEEKSLSLKAEGLPAGIYKLEIKVTDDTVIKRLSSSAGNLSFIHKIWPVSGSGLSLYTDMAYIQAKAVTPASCQDLDFAGQSFDISEPYKQFYFQSATAGSPGRNRISLEKDDIVLENAGVFSFATSSLFDPSWPKVDRFFSVKTAPAYIIADYQPPTEDDGWKTASAEFDVSQAYRQKGLYSFMVSIPGLSADDGTSDNLEISKIKIEFSGRNLWQMIFD